MRDLEWSRSDNEFDLLFPHDMFKCYEYLAKFIKLRALHN